MAGDRLKKKTIATFKGFFCQDDSMNSPIVNDHPGIIPPICTKTYHKRITEDDMTGIQAKTWYCFL